jgi:sodium-dependent dicarboxylate transporter 2/3/5
MSDVPVCALFMAIALGLLQNLRIEPGASNFGKALMLGIPIASLIGGVGTPAGSSINLLGIYFIEQYGKIRVPFLHWAAIGIPMALLLVPIAAWVVVRFFPPEVESIGDSREMKEQRAELGSVNPGEIRGLTILSIMITLWILGTWIRELDITMVAIAGAIAMFLPGIRLLTWSEVQRTTGWDTLLMIGSVTSLGAASVKTGLAKWLVDSSLSGVESWDLVMVIAAISAFTVVIHLVLPIGPVVNVVIIPPIVLLAQAAGHNPALYALPVAFTASCAFLLPLDAVALVTYSKGYYRMFDMLLPGTVISIAWVIVMTALMFALGPLLGFF